uniref:Uncharacterized protein n=1 Tax=Glossina brevipalpis TaxID=37001 RepID=A0A1A9WQW7_9MUSC
MYSERGMTFTIEPIFTFGVLEVEIQTDGWTATITFSTSNIFINISTGSRKLVTHCARGRRILFQSCANKCNMYIPLQKLHYTLQQSRNIPFPQNIPLKFKGLPSGREVLRYLIGKNFNFIVAFIIPYWIHMSLQQEILIENINTLGFITYISEYYFAHTSKRNFELNFQKFVKQNNDA